MGVHYVLWALNLELSPAEAKNTQPWSLGQLGSKSIKGHLSVQDV